MTHAFVPIYAKPTFGTLKENLNQSDYLNRKKGKLSYCKGPYGNNNKQPSSYSTISTYNLGRYARNLETHKIIPVHKRNLIIGQYTKLNLEHICTVSDGPPSTQYCSDVSPCNPCQNSTSIGVKIDPNTTTIYPFYQTATIDQLGELFGNLQCGELNYTQYMNYYPPIPY